MYKIFLHHDELYIIYDLTIKTRCGKKVRKIVGKNQAFDLKSTKCFTYLWRLIHKKATVLGFASDLVNNMGFCRAHYWTKIKSILIIYHLQCCYSNMIISSFGQDMVLTTAKYKNKIRNCVNGSWNYLISNRHIWSSIVKVSAKSQSDWVVLRFTWAQDFARCYMDLSCVAVYIHFHQLSNAVAYMEQGFLFRCVGLWGYHWK